MQLQVNSIQIDEKVEEPEPIDGQIECIPVNIIASLIEVVLEGDGKGRPDEVKEDDEGE